MSLALASAKTSFTTSISKRLVKTKCPIISTNEEKRAKYPYVLVQNNIKNILIAKNSGFYVQPMSNAMIFDEKNIFEKYFFLQFDDSIIIFGHNISHIYINSPN